jgi:hypothetical protein
LPALRDGKQVRFLFLPSEHDPDSYIREYGREAFEALIANAMPLSEYWLKELNARHPGDSAEAKAARASAARLHLELVSAPMMRESLASVLGRDVDMQSHTVLPPIKAKPVEASGDYEERDRPKTKFMRRRPPMPRTDPATQRVLANARRILGRPKLAMYLVDTQFPDPANAPHVLRLLKAVVNVAIRLPDDPNMGALMEQFRDSEFANEISKLLTDRDTELDAVISDEEAENELRQLRTQIEAGSLFHAGKAIVVPEHLPGAGILALGARRAIAPVSDEPKVVATTFSPARRDRADERAVSGANAKAADSKTKAPFGRGRSPASATSPRADPVIATESVAHPPASSTAQASGPLLIGDEAAAQLVNEEPLDDIAFDFDAKFSPASSDSDEPPF